MRSRSYDDPLAPQARTRPRDDRDRRPPPPLDVAPEPGQIVEIGSYCGAVVSTGRDGVELEDRAGHRRVFPYGDVAMLEGVFIRLTRPTVAAAAPTRQRSASGSIVVTDHRARVARAGRIWVEGLHDATLVERIWGHDLRVEGVVVEPLDGADDLPGQVAGFAPAPGRRLGVLVDHLVPGTKETRLAEQARARSKHVLVLGHPYVDVWQAVKPASVGIAAWPDVPRGEQWKDGICARLGWGSPQDGWRRVLAGVSTVADLEVPLLRAVEELVDFVTTG